MATVYRAPIDPPEVDYSNFDFDRMVEQEDEYLGKLREIAKESGKSELLGEELRWPRGDGYARYMIFGTAPLKLVWLELGDAWSVEEPLIRGLTVADAKQMVERERKFREIFSGKE